jgi:biofilm PGA synthesis N-glycosyltransferase PgaC
MSSAIQEKKSRYVVVSPVRDEAQTLEHTIRSMVQQTLRPVQWILVNDGSTDETGELINHWASQHSWILPVHLPDHSRLMPKAGENVTRGNSSRGRRAREAKEIEAFCRGYERITAPDWQFLAKLDGDVGFEPDYFERCMAEFATDPSLGIGGGVICHSIGGKLQVESNPGFHVRGATKIYKRACWEEIAGVISGAGWDTIDEVKANMLGWRTRSFTHLKVMHYRFTGAANGAWQNAIKNGIWSYICGYHPLFMLFRCGKRLLGKPSLIGSAGLLWGFLLGYIQNVAQIDDKSVIRYLRQQQLRRLTFRTTIWQ